MYPRGLHYLPFDISNIIFFATNETGATKEITIFFSTWIELSILSLFIWYVSSCYTFFPPECWDEMNCQHFIYQAAI